MLKKRAGKSPTSEVKDSSWRQRTLAAVIAHELEILDDQQLRDLLFHGAVFVNLLAMKCGVINEDTVSILFDDPFSPADGMSYLIGFEYAIHHYAPEDHQCLDGLATDNPFIEEFLNLPREKILANYISFMAWSDPLALALDEFSIADSRKSFFVATSPTTIH